MADLISRKVLVTKLSQGYWDWKLHQAKDDPCVIDAMIDWAIRIVNEMPLGSPWHTGTPTEETNEDNEYCYALMIYYDGWYLSDYLFKANHKEGCFETSPGGDEKPIKFKFSEDNPPFHTAIRWQKITPYEEKENGR